MRSTLRLATGAAVLGVVSIVGTPVALAQTAPNCAAYPGTCEKPGVLPTTATRQPTAVQPATVVRNRPSSLPFTGGETVLVGLAGAGAVAAGTVLVLGARRRAGATTA